MDQLETSFDSIDGYGAVYSIGKELFNLYDNEFIYELVNDKNNQKLNTVVGNIISDINEQLVTEPKHSRK